MLRDLNYRSFVLTNLGGDVVADLDEGSRSVGHREPGPPLEPEAAADGGGQADADEEATTDAEAPEREGMGLLLGLLLVIVVGGLTHESERDRLRIDGGGVLICPGGHDAAPAPGGPCLLDFRGRQEGWGCENLKARCPDLNHLRRTSRGIQGEDVGGIGRIGAPLVEEVDGLDVPTSAEDDHALGVVEVEDVAEKGGLPVEGKRCQESALRGPGSKKRYATGVGIEEDPPEPFNVRGRRKYATGTLN